MLLIAALTLSLFSHPAHPAAQSKAHAAAHPSPRVYRSGVWLLAVDPDPFTGWTTCRISAPDVSLKRDTLIFRVAREGDTTRAVYRVDAGPAHAVSDAFDAVEAHGFFPQRGWIVDPQGGEMALPAAYVANARTVTIRVDRKRSPRGFKVYGLAQAEASAKAAGCPA